MKRNSSADKIINKGKIMPSIQPYQDSRLTNKSVDTRKVDSKVSKVSKAYSCIKTHQPLSIQNRGPLKEYKLKNSKLQTFPVQDSRREIKSHLQNKQSHSQNLMSFRPIESNIGSSKKKQTSKVDQNKFKSKNEKLQQQNKQLKQKFYRMQQASLEDKQKIKTLIMRISQLKRYKEGQNGVFGGMSKSKTTASYAHMLKTRGLTQRVVIRNQNTTNQNQTPFRILNTGQGTGASQSKYSRNKQFCGNSQCEDRKKHLEAQLYKQRIKRDRLQQQKIDWERNKNQLKRQYQDLVCQIHNLREDGQSYED